MENFFLRFYQGNNVKRRKKVVRVSIESEHSIDIKVYLKNYFKICFLLGFKERLIDIEKGEINYLWVTYSQEVVSKYILINLYYSESSIEKIVEKACELVDRGFINYISTKLDSLDIPCIKLTNNLYQLGYGKNSAIIGDKYQHFENIDNAIISIDRQSLCEKFRINNKIQNKIGDYFLKCLKEEGIGLIPMISITGTNGKTTTARLIYIILNRFGIKTAITSTGGIFIEDKKIRSGDTTGFLSAREVLTDKSVEAAVLETARGGILKNGLGYEKAAAAIITSISEDHIGMDGIKSIKDLIDVKSVILDEVVTGGKLIVKAQSELISTVFCKMNYCIRNVNRRNMKRTVNKEISLFSLDKNIYIKEHVENGGEALYLEDEWIIYCKNAMERKILNVKQISFTYNGISKANILNVMAAIAGVSAIVDDIEKIVEILKDVKSDLYFNPGRQNVLDIGNFKVILDYGHNAESFIEVFQLAKSLNPYKLTAIIAAPGDRMDSYIKELGNIATRYSDFIIVREQADLRGRKFDESASLIRTGINEAGFSKEKITTIYKEEDAIEYAMRNAQKGEVIVLFTQCLDVIIPVINKYLENIGEKKICEDINFSH